jgi:hypothetical protein
MTVNAICKQAAINNAKINGTVWHVMQKQGKPSVVAEEGMTYERRLADGYASTFQAAPNTPEPYCGYCFGPHKRTGPR